MLLSELVGCEQPVDSVDKLVEYINGLAPLVFAIDNGHFLACRIMGAEAAIRVFDAVMVATQQRHLWVLGCEQFAWRRLGYFYRAGRYFSDCIELPLFSETELGQCLTYRLHMSGITLNTSTAGDHEQMQPALTRELPTLYKLSNGKPDVAIYYFLGSLCIHDGNTHLEMQPVVPLDFSILKQLISEELFTLAEVSVHGQLTIDDHSAVFRSSHEESWLLLERLYHRYLLEKVEKVENTAGISYRLVPVYSDVVTRYLAKANYLY